MKEVQIAPAPRRWTRKEYERMIDAGVFQPGERAELLDGEIISSMTPQKSPHATALGLAEDALREVFGSSCGYHIRSQRPLALGTRSQPEPDVAVAPGAFADYWDSHPTTAVLVVEVSDTTLALDRRKANLYARSGILDYWLLNLVKNILEVYREPIVDAKARYDWKYQLVRRLGPGDEVSPLAAPHARIAVARLLRPK